MLLADHLLIIKASQQYVGLQWRAYDTHFRVAVAASENHEWSKVNVDLYTRFITGREKAVTCCCICDSTLHIATNSPAKKREPPAAMQVGPPTHKDARPELEMSAFYTTQAEIAALEQDASSGTSAGSVVDHTQPKAARSCPASQQRNEELNQGTKTDKVLKHHVYNPQALRTQHI